jgi:hypothetical protein
MVITSKICKIIQFQIQMDLLNVIEEDPKRTFNINHLQFTTNLAQQYIVSQILNGNKSKYFTVFAFHFNC